MFSDCVWDACWFWSVLPIVFNKSCVFDILCTRETILPLRFLPLRKSLFLGALTSSRIGQDSSTSLAVDQNSAEKGFFFFGERFRVAQPRKIMMVNCAATSKG